MLGYNTNVYWCSIIIYYNLTIKFLIIFTFNTYGKIIVDTNNNTTNNAIYP